MFQRLINSIRTLLGSTRPAEAPPIIGQCFYAVGPDCAQPYHQHGGATFARRFEPSSARSEPDA